MRDDDMLYVKLGVDLSEFIGGFEEARKIAAKNMAQMKEDMRNFFGEVKRLDSGMIEREYFSEEDLKNHRAEQARSITNGKRGYYYDSKPFESRPEWDLNDLQKSAWYYRKKLGNAQAELQFGDDEYQKSLGVVGKVG